MKKLFLLIPALVLAIVMNAKEIEIGSSESNIIHYTIAASTTNNGDTIVLTDAGPYVNSKANKDDYTKISKNVTIKAADGIHPVIKLEVPIQARDGKAGKFIGIKFDGSSLQYDQFIFVKDDDLNDNELEFEDCEFYNFSKYIVNVRNNTKAKSLVFKNCKFYDNATNRGILNQGNIGHLGVYDCEFSGFVKDVIDGYSGTSHVDSCIVKNSYFHNHSRSAIFFEASTVDGQQTCDKLIVKNSTFANINGTGDYHSVIDIRPYSSTNSIKVEVDHCTFYNNTSINSDHTNIRTANISDVTVSNCIFAHSEEYDRRATYCTGGGNINNCLTYNYTADGTKGHAYGCTVNAASMVADPLFNDLANNKYTFDGNWVTMDLSPARGAATDGSDLGDPRWYSAEVLPSSNFVAPYAFIGAKAVVRDNMELDGNNYIHSKSAGGSAIWKIHATRAGNVQVTLNMDPDGQVIGHTYHVEVFDANGNSMGEVNEGGWYNNVDDKVLPGTIAFPAEGDYKIVLTNSVSGTKSTIKGITLAYAGGAIVNVPAEELLGTEAVRVDAGHLKVTKLANGDLQYGDNQYPLDEYVYWNINATKLGDMKVTLNVVAPGEGDPSSHEFLVELYSNLNESPISSSAEVSATSGTGARVLPTAINIPATGNYIVKLTNKKQWSSAILHSVEFEYLGGATITVPANELIAEEAVLVDGGHLRVSKLANGDLQYGDNEYPLQEYVYWNINATKYGSMNVTANVVFNTEKDAEHQSSHQFLVELYSDLNETPISSSEEESATSKTGEVHMPALNIPAVGTYIVKLTNKKQWSSAILHSVEFEYAGGEVAEVPGQILGVDAVIFDNGNVKMFHNADGDLEYGDNGTPNGEYAFWNINATAAGEMEVTLNIDPVRESGHNYRIELYDGNVLQDYSEELASTDPDAYVHTIGDVPLTKRLAIPAAGTYTLRVLNRGAHSSSILHGITFTPYVAPVAIIIDEMDEDNSAFADKVGGDAVNVQLKRTFKGGVYNTICLPFAVSSEKLAAAFGAGAELLYMSGASLEGGVLDLEFSTATSIYQGTPFLIKPVADVENPEFAGVSIVLDDAAGSATSHEGWAADFIGTFIKKDLAANPNNLYLGTDDKLYFSNNDVTIKGLRAYFSVNVPVQAIKRARIVAPNNMPTEIEIVSQQPKANSQKLIENGQLIIFRDGKKYNVMGIRL